MRRLSPKRRVHKDEAGYALVLIMFFLALLVLSTMAAAPTVLSNVQREKEEEMIWRGHQYVRGIRMYYMKMHRFPTSLDDLTTPKTGLRFMRKAYKDPTNTIDGTWRLIYVGPSGQLIGSLNNQALGMFGAMGGVQPAANVQQGSAFGGSASTFGSSFGSSFGSTGFGSSSAAGAANSTTASANQSGGQTAGASPTDTSTDPNAQNGDSSDQMGTPQSLGAMDASNTIGGNIIGVGGKIKKKSFMWYQKAKDYQHFEFIWDPSKDMQVGAASQGIGTPVQGTNGANPSGTGISTSPFSSGPNPQQNQNTNPNPNSNPDSNPMPPLQAPPPSQ